MEETETEMTEFCWLKPNLQVKSKMRIPEGSSDNSARKVPITLSVYLSTRQQTVKNSLYQ